MTDKFENGLFIFRRDLRIVDNNGLHLLSSHCRNVYTIFIFTPEQVGSANSYKSNNSVQFMIESLADLAGEIRKQGGQLHTFYGKNEKVVADCIKELGIQAVGFNLDITPYARMRDDMIIKLCNKMNVALLTSNDYFLNQPGEILTSASKEAYKKFTPYYDTARHMKVKAPTKMTKLGLHTSSAAANKISNKITLDQAMNKFTKINPHILVHGGRTNALKQMQIAAKNIRHYSSSRDEISKSTSQLSAFIKFGCVSIREVYHAFKSNTAFIRQLYWRDFYGQVVYHYPHVLGHALIPKYDKIKWRHNERLFNAWCNGKTGFPLVDASQRQLLIEGWVHNRARMISSSILTKIFMIDWRKGEKFYAQHLVDYDVANNNGGWGWSAGVGCDPQPWFRYFNPFLQSKEHDPECVYIKKYLPELKDVPAEDIHNWDTEWVNHKDVDYPKPIVDYSAQRDKSLEMYKDALY